MNNDLIQEQNNICLGEAVDDAVDSNLMPIMVDDSYQQFYLEQMEYIDEYDNGVQRELDEALEEELQEEQREYELRDRELNNQLRNEIRNLNIVENYIINPNNIQDNVNMEEILGNIRAMRSYFNNMVDLT